MIAKVMLSAKSVTLVLSGEQEFSVGYDFLDKISCVVGYDLVQQHHDFQQRSFDVMQCSTPICAAELKLLPTPSGANNVHMVYVGRLDHHAVYRCDDSKLMRFCTSLLDVDPQFYHEFYISEHE